LKLVTVKDDKDKLVAEICNVLISFQNYMTRELSARDVQMKIFSENLEKLNEEWKDRKEVEKEKVDEVFKFFESKSSI